MSARKQEKQPGEQIRFGPEGFSLLRDGRLEFHIEWAKVVGIAAFKRDLFAVDEIRLGFRHAGSWDYPCVGEQVAGFSELVDVVERRFAGCDPQWWAKVVQPPFELCWTVVWGDAPEPINCPTCGYDLRGLDNRRCPECGRTVPRDACPACHGRGVYRYYGLLWPALGVAAAGIGLYVALQGVWGGRLQFMGGIPLLVGGIAFVTNLIAGRTACMRCKGTGKRGTM